MELVEKITKLIGHDRSCDHYTIYSGCVNNEWLQITIGDVWDLVRMRADLVSSDQLFKRIQELKAEIESRDRILDRFAAVVSAEITKRIKDGSLFD